MRDVLGIVSGKGGVGKTTVCVNLGLAMHRLGEKVVLIDADMKNPNFGPHLDSFDYDMPLQDILEKDISPSEALHIHRTGLRFIPSHISLKYLSADSEKLERLKKYLLELDSRILLDTPPGLEKGTLSALEVCDSILVVSTPFLPDVTDCLKTMEVAKEMGKKVEGIVLNQKQGKGREIPPEQIESISDEEVLHSIPRDENVLEALARKTPVVEHEPHSHASVSFYKLAEKLTGKNWEKPRFLRLRRLLSL